MPLNYRDRWSYIYGTVVPPQSVSQSSVEASELSSDGNKLRLCIQVTFYNIYIASEYMYGWSIDSSVLHIVRPWIIKVIVCGDVQGRAGACRDVQGRAGTCRGVQGCTGACRDVQGRVGTCRGVQRCAGKDVKIFCVNSCFILRR